MDSIFEKPYLDIVCIEGEKVDLCVLRTDEDAIDLYTKWMNDASINMWISHNDCVDQWLSEKAWAEKEPEDCVWGIVDKKSRQLLDTCRKHRGESNSSLGICIGEASGRDRGIGTEVIKLMIKFAFNEQHAHRVELMANGDNARAIRCYEKAGFKECGRMHEADYYNGHYCDVVVMEILKKEWKK